MAFIRFVSVVLCCSMLFVFWASPLKAQSYEEADIKTAFVFNFLKFIAFPANTAKKPPSFSICVSSSEEFFSSVRSLEGREYRGKALVVKRLSDAAAVSECSVLYISKDSRLDIISLFKQIRGQGVLTIGESADFCQSGGIIRLYKQRGRIRFVINLSKAKSESIVFSSKLLRLAKIVSFEGH